ncbi:MULTISPECIES: tetratricopeptide repeat protein [unclassified Saccharopolyspora]|uniref:AfsR/SARP family transcriptional regulator n=1 Tax=unclassified Saccharopolyspora TaxID=2646250 RepID=UPI001CD1A6A9|nr:MULTISPECIES: tetratricopeptide repeat protein [unclassified Saccharopolyspora]MCA1186185.1 tetratricopeptide repeat protein [Saccharopolyspora sp. 6T]MCA1278388.1 tetratricopeptide repeat protein [Saccharopolyspora sp. 7B]
MAVAENLRIRLLGRVAVLLHGEVQQPQHPKVLAALAAVALTRNGRISDERLAEQLAGRKGPLTKVTLRTYRRDMRKLFPGPLAVLERDRGMTCLAVEDEQIDLWRFRKLMADADESDPALRVEMLQEARKLWDFDEKPLSGIGDDVDFSVNISVLQQERAEMYQKLIDAMAERADVEVAYAVIEEARRCCPGEIDRFEGAARDLARRNRMQPSEAAPNNLPNVRTHLFARTEHLAQLDEVLSPRTDAPQVAAITGPPGAGKSTLAVSAARSAAVRFPGGVRYVDLRGYSEHQRKTTKQVVAEIFGGWDLKVPDGGEQELLGRFLSEIAARSPLLVFDNVVDFAHVQGLLPGSPDTAAVVTSRSRLVDLLVSRGAAEVELEPLDDAASLDLLAEMIGTERARREHKPVEDLAAACGGSPLLLTVVGAQIRRRPKRSISLLWKEWENHQRFLGFPVPGHPGLELRAVLSWSYEQLSPVAARLFRACGLHPGSAAVGRDALFHMVGGPRATLGEGLDELIDGNLLQEVRDGRYQLHDVIQPYAADRAMADMTGAERDGQRERLLEYLLHAGYQCDLKLDSGRELKIGSRPADMVLPEPASKKEAVRWLDRHYPTYTAMLNDEGLDPPLRYCVLLPLVLVTFQWRRGHWNDAVKHLIRARNLCTGPKPAWPEGQDPGTQMLILRLLAGTYRLQRKYPLAESNVRQAIGMSVQAGNTFGEATGRQLLGVLHEKQKRWEDARSEFERSVELFRSQDDARGQAHALNGLAGVERASGRVPEALDRARTALQFAKRASDANGLAAVHRNLASLLAEQGRLVEAVKHFSSAIEVYVELRSEHNEARVQKALAEQFAALGDEMAERRALRRARKLFQEIGDLSEEDQKDQQQVERRLAHLESS